MARFYDIKIFPAGTASDTGTPQKAYTSFPKVNGVGKNDPGALDVLLDAYTVAYSRPTALTVLQIKGISIADISQATQLTNCVIFIYAGFKAGLPLNNPNQAGLIIKGEIQQSFANWQGTEMSLNLVIRGPGDTAVEKTNISFLWNAGTPLSSALATTLSTAFPGVKQNIQISPKLVVSHTETGSYQSMPAFAQYLKTFTKSIVGGNYPGVDIVWTPTQINAIDQSSSQGSAATTIAFSELIGQPIWIAPYTIQWMCPMRADLTVGSAVTMPQGLLGNPNNPAGAPGAVTTTSASQPQARQASIFNGTFNVIQVHHMGIFRQPDGMSWVTVFNAVLPATGRPTTTTPTESLATVP